jgi:polyphosphate kinase
MGTGNYNPNTARVYTDYGLLTADPEIGADATDLFNYLTGLSRQRVYRKLIVAPVNLRAWSMEMIEREMAHARAGRPARIVAKLYAMTDTRIMRKLARASNAGVRVDLVVRGTCCLRPGVPGLSENIQVISVVGRFLEHSRVFYFENGGDAEIFLSSADWMERNLEARVETAFPILDPRLKTRLQTELLNVMLLDNTRAHELGMDGVYRRRNSDVARLAGESAVDSQRYFLAAATVSHY